MGSLHLHMHAYWDHKPICKSALTPTLFHRMGEGDSGGFMESLHLLMHPLFPWPLVETYGFSATARVGRTAQNDDRAGSDLCRDETLGDEPVAGLAVGTRGFVAAALHPAQHHPHPRRVWRAVCHHHRD